MVKRKNALRELFISIGIKGSKTASSNLDRVTRAENRLGDEVDRTDRKLNRQMNIFRRLGASFRGFGRALKVFALPLKGVGRAISGVTGFLSNTLSVMLGTIGARLASILTTKVTQLIGSSVTNAVAEESARVELQRALFMKDAYTQRLDASLNALAGQLQGELGISADDLLSGLAKFLAAGNDPALSERVLVAAARLSDVSGKQFSTVIEQMSSVFQLGLATRTIKGVVPQLDKLTQEEMKSVKSLELIESRLETFSRFQDNSMDRIWRRFQQAWGEYTKVFGRPIVATLKDLLKIMLGAVNYWTRFGIGFTYTTSIVNRMINTVKSWFVGADKLLGVFRITKLDLLLGQIIKTFSKIAIDIVNLLLGEDSLIGRFLEKQGFSKDLLGLIEWTLVNFFKELLGLVWKALMSLVPSLTIGGTEQGLDEANNFMNKQLKNIGIHDQVADYLYPPDKKIDIDNIQKTEPFIKDVLDILQWGTDQIKGLFNSDDSTLEEKLNSMGDDARVIPQLQRNEEAPINNTNNSEQVVINQDVKINTNQPIRVIEEQLASSLMQYAGYGRVV